MYFSHVVLKVVLYCWLWKSRNLGFMTARYDRAIKAIWLTMQRNSKHCKWLTVHTYPEVTSAPTIKNQHYSKKVDINLDTSTW